MASAVDSTDIVYTAYSVHHTSKAATAALGRTLTAASMMGAMLKQKDAFINLHFQGGGPIGTVVAVAGSSGNVRGYVGDSDCETHFYPNGKINVAKAVGNDGILTVMRDYGIGEPYIGKTEIVSGEIAEDIANYYAVSEQIPTVCALGVLVDKESSQPLLSGGLLIQLLPGADDSTIDKIEENISLLEPVTTMLSKGFSVLDICKKALDSFEVEVLDEFPVKYVCTCSREKLENIIAGLSDEEIRELYRENGFAQATCHFCNKHYTFTKSELEEFIAKRRNEAQ